MPTYEYECKSCGYLFEVFQSMSEKPLSRCPQCGKEVRRLINGGSGIIFKGSGFYVTDKKGGTKPAAAKPAEGGASDKPAVPSAPKTESGGAGPVTANQGGQEKKAAG
ncbi:MAG: zinc ribbon domain-containing protein [Spirochaetaceae bacterium]|jgi:putative FmdB family regulatory protein|nr:zinc ribbon domain-containing protein [Spirochaetaceae bacterium]